MGRVHDNMGKNRHLEALIHKKKLTIDGIEPVWLSFSYKKLPDFCCGCGLFGHGHKDCLLPTMENGESNSEVVLPYG